MTKYSNYVAFDEALAFLDRLVLLFLTLALLDPAIGRALCDKSQRLEAITIVTQISILYDAGVLDRSLKSIDKLR